MNALGLNLPLALPSFFPDETLYSLASRFHVISGGRIPSTTCKLLFGHRYQGSQHDLPNRIGEFCSRTEGLLGDEKSIALTRTLVPFYLPLQSPIDAENAMQSMIGRQTGMLKFRLGILTSRFRANHPLKACPLCISEDQEAHGVAYWHLQHQYPGVWISDSWMANMRGHLQVAQEYGLFSGEISEIRTPEELLNAARSVLNTTPDHSESDAHGLQKASETVLKLEVEEENLSDEIGRLKKRLDDIGRLKVGFIDYGGSTRKRVERLQISQWLDDLSSESKDCPLCGSDDHKHSNAELKKVSAAFKKVEEESKSIKEIPLSFSREEESIKSQMEELLGKKRALNGRLDKIMAQDKVAHEQFQRRKNLFLFLGHFEASLQTFENLADGGELDEQIRALENEYSNLMKSTDPRGVQRRVDIALREISQGILTHLGTLDVEDKYRRVAPQFSIKDLNLLVPSSDSHWHFLAEVGSASNWVSFHLALMCALQEYFLRLKGSCVPSFVIFDQPSQVYFPKLKRAENKEDDPKYEDEDVDAVKKIFITLANSVIASNGAWQCIVLDHAGDEIYGDIEGVHEVDVWRDGKKLIPLEWYS